MPITKKNNKPTVPTKNTKKKKTDIKKTKKKSIKNNWESSFHKIIGPSNVTHLKKFPQQKENTSLYDYMENVGNDALKKYIKDEKLHKIDPSTVHITSAIGPFFEHFLIKYTFHFTTIPEDKELRRLKTFHKINYQITYLIIEQLYIFDDKYSKLTRYISIQDFVNYDYKITASDKKELDLKNVIQYRLFDDVPIISDADFSQLILSDNDNYITRDSWAMSKKFKVYVMRNILKYKFNGRDICATLTNGYTILGKNKAEDTFMKYVYKCTPYNIISTSAYQINVLCTKRINDMIKESSIVKVKQKIYIDLMKEYIMEYPILHEARNYVNGKNNKGPDERDNFFDLNIFNCTKKEKKGKKIIHSIVNN